MSGIARVWGGTQGIDRRDICLAGVVPPLVFNLAVSFVVGILAVWEGVSVLVAIPTLIVLHLNAAKRWHDMGKSGRTNIAFGFLVLRWAFVTGPGYAKGQPYSNDYRPQRDLAVPTANPS